MRRGNSYQLELGGLIAARRALMPRGGFALPVGGVAWPGGLCVGALVMLAVLATVATAARPVDLIPMGMSPHP